MIASRFASVSASMLLCAAATFAQKPDTAESSQGHGFPWIAHTSADGFYMASPAAKDGGGPYQFSLYQGFTIQSLSFAWFHVGLRTRETYAPGFSQPYREPFNLKLQATAEVIPEYVYVSLGGNIPILADSIALADTLPLYDAMNGYSPMPYSAFLSPQALQASAYARYAWASLALMGGVSYVRPALFEPVKDREFFPASWIDIYGRALIQGGKARHRWDAKVSVFLDEDTKARIPAHDEGDLYQLRYGYLKTLGRVAWQAGTGAAMKLPDANRRIRLESELVKTESNDNLQRAYLEFSVAWAAKRDFVWRLHAAPRAIFTFDGTEFGHETEAGVSLGLRIWENHRIRLAGSALYGQFGDQTYTGFGFRAEFAFRHLGYQDLGEGGDEGSE
jgi:hypothetical protein